LKEKLEFEKLKKIRKEEARKKDEEDYFA